MEQFHPDFFDSEGMLRPYRTTEYGLPENKPSGNPFLYTAYLYRLCVLSGYFPDRLWDCAVIKSKNISTSISHDEMTGLCCMNIEFKIWYSRCWYRTELFLYWHSKKFLLGTILLPILFLKMILTCAILQKAPNGLPDTDGPLQAWLICESFGFERVGKICMWFNEKNFGENPLSKMFSTAFNRDADHPCRILSRRTDGTDA